MDILHEIIDDEQFEVNLDQFVEGVVNSDDILDCYLLIAIMHKQDQLYKRVDITTSNLEKFYNKFLEMFNREIENEEFVSYDEFHEDLRLIAIYTPLSCDDAVNNKFLRGMLEMGIGYYKKHRVKDEMSSEAFEVLRDKISKCYRRKPTVSSNKEIIQRIKKIKH